MSWKQFLQPDVKQFILDHEHDDVRDLALKKSPDASWSYGVILDQIKVRQKARLKSPDLYETDGIIFPDSSTFEQASSSACAAYKALLVNGRGFVDLTAGSGIDAFHIAKGFDYGDLIERDCNSSALLEYNISVLLNVNCELSVCNIDALEYAQSMDGVDFVFIDPQRRESGRKGIFDLASCSPDIISLLPILRGRVKKLMIKTSPVLDIEKAITSLNDAVGLQVIAQVHVVQWQGDCKEVLYMLDFNAECAAENVVITSVQINSDGGVQKTFSYKIAEEKSLSLDYSLPLKYIYEPGAAFQKSGGFKSMAVQFDVNKLHPNSHLYTSDIIREDFPGKRYEVVRVASAKAKGLGVVNADLKLRNFPDTVKNLKKKLKITDGGEHRIFATTLCNQEKKLIICSK